MRPRAPDGGVAAVEFAMVLVPLLMFVMGAIDWGWYFHLRHVATNAAREGARFGSTRPQPTTTCSSTGTPLSSTTESDIRARIEAYLQGTGVAGATIALSCVGATFGRLVRVELGYPSRLVGFWSFVPARHTVTVQMRWE